MDQKNQEKPTESSGNNRKWGKRRKMVRIEGEGALGG